MTHFIHGLFKVNIPGGIRIILLLGDIWLECFIIFLFMVFQNLKQNQLNEKDINILILNKVRLIRFLIKSVKVDMIV